MRRRSNRSAKAVEETAEVVSPRKSKRQPKRRKQSTSESDDEPISALIEKNVDSDVVENEPENESEEQIWKVASSPQSTDGEIQKLKICLTKPSASPEKSTKTHTKSTSHHEDEQTEEKCVRRSSRRGKANVDENRSEDDIHEIEDKGKLKGKSKSKTEKLSDCDPCNDETSENTINDDNISDNVQIEPQTVQSDYINTLPGKENADIEIEREEIVQTDNAPTTIDNKSSATTVEIIEIIEIVDDVVTVENVSEQIDKQSTSTGDDTIESASIITSPVILEQIVQQIEIQADSDEVAQKVENDNKEKEEEEATLVREQDEEKVEVETEVEEQPKEAEVEKNAVCDGSEEKIQEVDATEETNVAISEEKDKEAGDVGILSDKDKEDEDDKSDSLNVTNDEVINMEEPPALSIPPPPPARVCVYPKSMLAKNLDSSEQKPKLVLPRLSLIKLPKLPERKRKWGASTQDKRPELKLVTTNIIVEIYPDCKLIDENEVNLDLTLMMSSPSPAKVKRKISIDMSKPEPRPQPKPESQSKSSNGILDHVHDREKDDQASIIALNRKISIVEDTAANLKPPPSPAKNPVDAVLYISNLVRPFTLKQLKELLERTGKIADGGFWTDRIKSKCYAQYETSEEAEATRNALHGIHWPIGNGKKLMIEYSTPEDMELAKNPPPIQLLVPPIINSRVPEPNEKENKEPARRIGTTAEEHRDQFRDEEQHQERHDRRDIGGADAEQRRHVREWDMGKGEKSRRSRSRSRDRRGATQHSHSRSGRSASPRGYDRYKPQPKVDEPPPQKLMDDLFLKTKSTPCIYWQALTPEEIALKQQQRLERMAEHQRRLQQTTNSGGLGSSGVGGVGGGGGGGGGFIPAPQHSRAGYSALYGGPPRRRY